MPKKSPTATGGRGSSRPWNFGEPEYARYYRHLVSERRALLREMHRRQPGILEDLWRNVMPLYAGTIYWEGGVVKIWEDPPDARSRSLKAALIDWAERNNLVAEYGWPLSEAMWWMYLWSDRDLTRERVIEIGWKLGVTGLSSTVEDAPPLEAPRWEIQRFETEASYRERVDRYVAEMKRWARSVGGREEAGETRSEIVRLARFLLGESCAEIAGKGRRGRAADNVRRAVTRLARKLGLKVPRSRKRTPT